MKLKCTTIKVNNCGDADVDIVFCIVNVIVAGVTGVGGVAADAFCY